MRYAVNSRVIVKTGRRAQEVDNLFICHPHVPGSGSSGCKAWATQVLNSEDRPSTFSGCGRRQDYQERSSDRGTQL